MRETAVFSAPGTLLGSDEITHARVRRIVGRAFASARVTDFAELIKRQANELFEHHDEHKQCELIGDFALPIALSVVAAMLGIERAHMPDLRRWSAAVLGVEDPTLPPDERGKLRAEVAECHAFFVDHVARLAGAPPHRYTAQFLTENVDQNGLSLDERVGISIFLLVAGTESMD
jgi:pimeloyl-[acyl-carrier protein] synthase